MCGVAPRTGPHARQYGNSSFPPPCSVFEELFDGLLDPDEVVFAVLLRGYGTAGDRPQWNEVRRATRHPTAPRAAPQRHRVPGASATQRPSAPRSARQRLPLPRSAKQRHGTAGPRRQQPRMRARPFRGHPVKEAGLDPRALQISSTLQLMERKHGIAPTTGGVGWGVRPGGRMPAVWPRRWLAGRCLVRG